MLTQIVIVGRSFEFLSGTKRKFGSGRGIALGHGGGASDPAPGRRDPGCRTTKARRQWSGDCSANPPFLSYNLRMIPKDLLDILVCPACKKPLVMKDQGESLKCGECHRVYPVRDDIPILLVDEATIEP